jgi:REP element-mobilizing transposase RayT
MPRLPRVYIEGSLYYITCRSLPNQTIFKDKEDYTMYFGLVKKYKQELGVKIYAYTLMPTHLHLLCEVDSETSISTFMHNLNSSYTKYFNSRYSRKGHLFRERFRAAIVQKDPQILLNLTAHIHLNAERLNLDLEALSYPHSSYKLYLDYDQHNDHGLDIKTEVEQIIGALVGENYSDFIGRISAKQDFKKLHKQLQGKKIVGTAGFVEKVKKEIELQRMQNEKEANSAQQPQIRPARPTAVILLALTIAGIYVYFNYSRPAAELPQSKEVATEPKEKETLEMTEWQVQIIKPDGVPLVNDVMSFKNKKFSSAYLSQLSFPHTNYSMAYQDDAIIWETMQTSPNGTASWRGEVRDGQMQGILCMRQDGQKQQDFTFRSLKHWRR